MPAAAEQSGTTQKASCGRAAVQAILSDGVSHDMHPAVFLHEQLQSYNQTDQQQALMIGLAVCCVMFYGSKMSLQHMCSDYWLLI